MRAANVAQLEELQEEVPLALHVAGGEGRDIDLSLLTSFLCAYDQVRQACGASMPWCGCAEVAVG